MGRVTKHTARAHSNYAPLRLLDKKKERKKGDRSPTPVPYADRQNKKKKKKNFRIFSGLICENRIPRFRGSSWLKMVSNDSSVDLYSVLGVDRSAKALEIRR